jgi:hypothetical protein
MVYYRPKMASHYTEMAHDYLKMVHHLPKTAHYHAEMSYYYLKMAHDHVEIIVGQPELLNIAHKRLSSGFPLHSWVP